MADETFSVILSKWMDIFKKQFDFTLVETLGESECDGKIPPIDGYSAQDIFHDLHGENNIKLLHFSSATAELFCICNDWLQFWHRISGYKDAIEWHDFSEQQKRPRIKELTSLFHKNGTLEECKDIRTFLENKNFHPCELNKTLFIHTLHSDNSVLLFDMNYERAKKEVSIKLKYMYQVKRNGLLVQKETPAEYSVQHCSYDESLHKIDDTFCADFSASLSLFEKNIYEASRQWGLKEKRADIEDFIRCFEQWKD